MHKALAELIANNRLQEIDTCLYMGRASHRAGGRIYGGEVLAQALSAAQQTVESRYGLHSLHSYFLRPGDPARPVIYDVDPIRDGRSFCTRRVVARQRGKAIFNAAISFQQPEEGFVHQAAMPEVPGPEDLATDAELYSEFFPVHEYGWPLEFRQVSPMNLREPTAMEPVSYTWFRATERIGDDLSEHQQLLAYASDNPILITALRPHGVSHLDPGTMIITIDHALWFHRPFRVDEWLLYEVHSDAAGGGRGLSRGRIYNRGGELVVSVSQEGLIRRRR